MGDEKQEERRHGPKTMRMGIKISTGRNYQIRVTSTKVRLKVDSVEFDVSPSDAPSLDIGCVEFDVTPVDAPQLIVDCVEFDVAPPDAPSLVVECVEFDVVPDPRIERLKTAYREKVKSLPAESLQQILRQIFAQKVESSLDSLTLQARSGEFPLPPDIQFVPGRDLKGNNAAYSQAGEGIIFLRTELEPQEQALHKAFFEEAGHHLDRVLGGRDTKGDEGEMWERALAKGGRLASREMMILRRDRDAGSITVAGVRHNVEFQAGDPNLDGYWAPSGALGSFVKFNHQGDTRVFSGRFGHKDGQISGGRLHDDRALTFSFRSATDHGTVGGTVAEDGLSASISGSNAHGHVAARLNRIDELEGLRREFDFMERLLTDRTMAATSDGKAMADNYIESYTRDIATWEERLQAFQRANTATSFLTQIGVTLLATAAGMGVWGRFTAAISGEAASVGSGTLLIVPGEQGAAIGSALASGSTSGAAAAEVLATAGVANTWAGRIYLWARAASQSYPLIAGYLSGQIAPAILGTGASFLWATVWTQLSENWDELSAECDVLSEEAIRAAAMDTAEGRQQLRPLQTQLRDRIGPLDILSRTAAILVTTANDLADRAATAAVEAAEEVDYSEHLAFFMNHNPVMAVGELLGADVDRPEDQLKHICVSLAGPSVRLQIFQNVRRLLVDIEVETRRLTR